MASQTTVLTAARREPGSSRATRRLRRTGRVPGVVYGGAGEPVAFDVDARELRQALAAGGQVIELRMEGDRGQPVVLKDHQRHPVRGETLHIDLLRIRLDQPIHATVPLELSGAADAPGVHQGGVLEHVTRELNVEALPTEIPDVIHFDVSGLELMATAYLRELTPPPGVTLLDDLEETVVATITPPSEEIEPGEEPVETETERVGDLGAEAQADAAPPPGEGELPNA
jgi:large subunit ribosomal protein L25